MSDVFISYSREDRDKAEELARLFERYGWTVWWDRNIPAGKRYAQIIGEELATARSILVLWSQSSVASDWVKDEAQEGVNRGILVPALIEEVHIPYGFRQHQAANLSDWDGSASHPEMKMLLDAMSKLINKPRAAVDTGRLNTRSFFSRRRVPLIIGASAVVLLAAALFVFMNFRGVGGPDPGPGNNNRGGDPVNTPTRSNSNRRPGQEARVRAAKLTADGINMASDGNHEGAILMYNEAVDAFPSYADAYFYRGQSHVITKQNNKAKDDFQKVLELGPDADREAKVKELLKNIQSPPPPPPPSQATAPASPSVRAEVRKMFSDSKVSRIEATTKLISSGKQDPKAMSVAIAAAKADPKNKSGVINTLVLLESMDPAILKANRAEIEELLKLVNDNGPDTQDHIRKIRAIMDS